ncbi:PREDICTED: insulin-like 3 [Branchiostoma belcheri]|uniref:Insulin-like 3 n=1 Tax=Branchiostoma belcheri TaxID=7741 RepID=A0A6P4ZZQ3_BRABE|nr:PREDICTED: insulin-like 3 [Branchiostoma belcheri]
MRLLGVLVAALLLATAASVPVYNKRSPRYCGRDFLRFVARTCARSKRSSWAADEGQGWGGDPRLPLLTGLTKHHDQTGYHVDRLAFPAGRRPEVAHHVTRKRSGLAYYCCERGCSHDDVASIC